MAPFVFRCYVGDLEHVCAELKLGVSIVPSACGTCHSGGSVCSVRVHLDPFVQAAGEHHPTDLKTGSVRSKIAA